MTALVVGASGATGRLLVEELLNRGQKVKVIVRSPDKLPEILKNHDDLTVITPASWTSATRRWSSTSMGVTRWPHVWATA